MIHHPAGGFANDLVIATARQRPSMYQQSVVISCLRSAIFAGECLWLRLRWLIWSASETMVDDRICAWKMLLSVTAPRHA